MYIILKSFKNIEKNSISPFLSRLHPDSLHKVEHLFPSHVIRIRARNAFRDRLSHSGKQLLPEGRHHPVTPSEPHRLSRKKRTSVTL